MSAPLASSPQHAAQTAPAPAIAAARRALVLTAWCTLALLAMLAVILISTPGLDGIRMAIRATARTSLLFFLLAFGAGAAFTLWPSAATRWGRIHRRQWGWLFVISHTVHALGFGVYFWMAPAHFMANVPMGTIVGGGIAYLVIWAMGATSFDRSAAWLGRKAWSRLHTWGSHYIWLIFFMGNAKRVPLEPVYALPAALLAAVMLLRWWAAWRLRAGSTSAAPA